MGNWQSETMDALQDLFPLLRYKPDIMFAANRKGLITDHELAALCRWYSRTLE